ncbi:MAG TPA: archease [Candidatus Nanoarchaeia archaeon]|nr:archease [Candidatus Nanoarchaeia archaeon]
MKFKFLEHTADAKMQAFGATLEEAFSNAALGMFNVMVDTSKIKQVKKHLFTIKSENEESLLYDFLEHLLFLIDSEDFLLSEVLELTIIRNKVLTLVARVIGDNHTNQEVHSYIKAVTYSEMFIKKEKGKYVIQVVFDI